ncbi:MAG: hypothetical protein AB7O96_11145 [Pseudobdellovibrionaceae bacterium]
MGKLANFLKEYRKEKGELSAKTFHSGLSRRGFDCNYPYYMKIESGKILPSSDLVNQLAYIVGGKKGKLLIKAYCEDQFPKHAEIFVQDFVPLKGNPQFKEEAEVGNRNFGQKEISRRQVASLLKSNHHYWIFVLMTLSRRPLKFVELEDTFSEIEISSVVEDLKNEKLVLESGDRKIEALYPDIRFPDSKDSEELQKIYATFDLWDRQLVESSLFQTLFKRILLRRISPRYLNIVSKQLESLTEIIKSADEIDSVHNDEVVYLQILFKKGRLPG